MQAIRMRPIGVVRSAFSQRFGIPRQAGLCDALTSTIVLDPEQVTPDSLRGIGECSHVWVLTWMHESVRARGASTVRPPRLGGARRMGWIATRSPFRANPIGLSACRLRAIRDLELELEGGDFLDGSPVLDIKPYVPYADCLAEATSSWAAFAPLRLAVRWSSAAALQVALCPDEPWLAAAIQQVLGLDPRPARESASDILDPEEAEHEAPRRHVVRLLPFDVHFCVDHRGVEVLEIVRLVALSDVPLR